MKPSQLECGKRTGARCEIVNALSRSSTLDQRSEAVLAGNHADVERGHEEILQK